MHSSELRIFNQTRGSFLPLQISLIDAHAEPLRVLKVFVEGLAAGEPTGIWLKPLRGIPPLPRIAPFDLVFLDERECMLRGLELKSAEVFPRPETEAVSALILPWRTLSSSQLQPGDLIALRPTKESESVSNRALFDESLKTRFERPPARPATLDLPTPMRLLEPDLTAGSRSVLFRRMPQPQINPSISITVSTSEAIPAQSPVRIAAQPRRERVAKPHVRHPLPMQRAAERVFLATSRSMSSARTLAAEKFAALNRVWLSFRARDFRPARSLRRSPSIVEEC